MALLRSCERNFAGFPWRDRELAFAATKQPLSDTGCGPHRPPNRTDTSFVLNSICVERAEFARISSPSMPHRLQHELKKTRPFELAEQEAYLNVLRTAQVLNCGFERLFRPFKLSLTQYNVLRILRGVGEPLPSGQIAERLVTRDPDITRLLDRLEKRGLIARQRGEADRRVVLASITQQGLEILARLDQPVLDLHRAQLSHLGAERLKTLIELLEFARSIPEPAVAQVAE
jgi:DNA-binding MarR family transcriptional regulator